VTAFFGGLIALGVVSVAARPGLKSGLPKEGWYLFPGTGHGGPRRSVCTCPCCCRDMGMPQGQRG